MVNVRKISAIAAGALFVGATIGFAAAVTVPSDFSKDMLAKNGEEQAQLVVGANAPGKDADTASANVIKDAVADKLAVAGAGGDIQIAYGMQDIYDDWSEKPLYSNHSNFTGIYKKNGPWLRKSYDKVPGIDYDDGYLLLIGNKSDDGLRFDANGDGDVKDSDDYVIYNAIYVIDKSNGEIRMAYVLNNRSHSTYSNNDDKIDKGEVYKIKGKNYVITDDPDDQDFKIAPAIKKTLTSQTLDPDKATVIEGDIKVLYREEGNDANMYFYSGNNLIDGPFKINASGNGFNNKKYLTDDFTSDEMKAYKAWAWRDAANPKKAYLVLGKKSDEIKISNDEEDVLGYAKVKVDDTDFPSIPGNGQQIVFLSDVVTLEKDETVDIPGTEFQIKFTMDKDIDVKRKKTKSFASGTKIKENQDPGKDFLKEDITVTATGGETKTPELEIVDEDSADKSMNLVLIGGPVANTLTADLVTAGKSTVDWYNSEGDIEVIADAFTTGKYAIIVAGKDREATRAAADALAAAL